MNISEQEILQLIQEKESLTLEFKSDKKKLPDRDLIAAIVSLANTDGGTLLLGVEDDGTITGLHSTHINTSGLAERTGRGIDRIYEGMLRYGRPAPDYSMSNAFTVSVIIKVACSGRRNLSTRHPKRGIL